MTGEFSEFLECNMEIDRMINEGLAGGTVDLRYPMWQLEVHGVQVNPPLNNMGCKK